MKRLTLEDLNMGNWRRFYQVSYVILSVAVVITLTVAR